jgi:ATP-dependent DNA helicase RecQ
MRELAQQILKKHWGYDAFRPGQIDIVESLMLGKDTLALLPTGGGKSIQRHPNRALHWSFHHSSP